MLEPIGTWCQFHIKQARRGQQVQHLVVVELGGTLPHALNAPPLLGIPHKLVDLLGGVLNAHAVQVVADLVGPAQQQGGTMQVCMWMCMPAADGERVAHTRIWSNCRVCTTGETSVSKGEHGTTAWQLPIQERARVQPPKCNADMCVTLNAGVRFRAQLERT
jgi:hypothetical protein